MHRLYLIWISLLSLAPASLSAQQMNGFDLGNAIIPRDAILSGGPPRDGIPSIDEPNFLPVSEVDYLTDDDLVVGLDHGGQARAYPLRILVWHEIVNDTIKGEPVAVTYCPLCGTAMVFDRTVDGGPVEFGVSGLLYQSDVLMYDRASESLWSQLSMKAVSGPQVGTKLRWLPSDQMTWSAWRERHSDGQVLSQETGFKRDYRRNAYSRYFESDTTMFPVPAIRHELPRRDWVVGIIVDGQPKAYRVGDLPTDVWLEDKVGDRAIRLRYQASARHVSFGNMDGEPIPSVGAFWFAWQAFYPATDIWSENTSRALTPVPAAAE